MNYRFALRNYKGEPVRYFLVEEDPIQPGEVEDSPEPAHHVFIVDASGSMYRDMSAMKSTIEKVLTLEEYRDSGTLFSLLSYASHGDLKIHFSRVKVSEINTPGSA